MAVAQNKAANITFFLSLGFIPYPQCSYFKNDFVFHLTAKEKFQRENASYQDSGYVAEDDGILFIHPDPSVVAALTTLGGVKSSVCAQQTLLQKDVGPPGTALCGSSVMFVIHARYEL